MNPWPAVRNLLAVRLDNLGDVLMTTPALRALKQDDDITARRVTLLTSRSGAAGQPHWPWLDDVIVYDAPWSKGPGVAARDVESDLRLVEQLKQRRFDAAVIFTTCTQSALPAAMLLRWAGIPIRAAHCRENPYDLLTHWVPDHETVGDAMRHEVERQLDLLRAVGLEAAPRPLSFLVRAEDRAGLQRTLAQGGIDRSRPMVMIHPGATASSRRYPPERFGEVAAAIVAASDCQVIVVGSRPERPLVDAVLAAAGPSSRTRVSAAPDDLSLGELGALIESAAVVICNNSGPAHIAAASGTPVVVLYALTNPQHTPWQVTARVMNRSVPCRHCLKSVCPALHHACLLGVPPDAVAREALALIGASRVRRAA